MSVQASSVFAASTPQYTALTGSVLPQTAIDHSLGHHNPNSQLTIELVLNPSNQAGLNSLMASLYNPQSSQYHRWLATGQFASMFGPTRSQLAAVTAFLKQAGLHVVGGSSSAFLLRAAGTSSQVETAFHTTINDYQAANGARYYANATSAQIPSSLTSIVAGVMGLDNAVVAHPHYIKQQATKNGQKPHFGGGPNGTGLTPSQIAGIYLADPVYNSLKDTGAGETLAVFELSAYTASDISTYESQFGLGSLTPTDINVDGGPSDDSGAIEVELDIELQLAIAPGAKAILVYNAPNSDAGVADEYARIASDNTADAISTSWGLCEADNDSSTRDSEFTSFEQMATQGQTIFAAAGDSGAFDCLPDGSGNGSNQVDDPASQIYMTGVGGTSLAVDPGTNPNPIYTPGEESVWNDGCTSSDCSGGAGGGGNSRDWARPPYQTGPGVVNSYSKSSPWCDQPAGTACREVPDVSINADENTGYAEYCTNADSCGATGWLQIGGTSCAAPLWAAIVALTDSHHGKRLGEASFSLYHYDSTNGYTYQFHDITSGNNGWFPARANYDMSTGIGTPKIYYLVTALP